MRSSWPARGPTGSHRRPRPTALPDPPRHVRPDRAAADARGGRRLRRRPAPPTPTSALVDRLLASRTTASAGAGTGSTSSGSARATGTRPTLPRPAAWPYRDYVIRAFNRDTPFPRFVLEQLAGDTHRRDGRLADAGGDRVPGRRARTTSSATRWSRAMLQQRADDLDDMITATGTAFLGLTVQCARCHDHKFDPITQTRLLRPPGRLRGGRPRPARGPRAGSRVAASRGRRRSPPSWRGSTGGWTTLEPLASPDRDAPARPMVNPRRNVERFAPVAGPDRPLHDPRDQRRHRALHRRAGGLHGRTANPSQRRAGRGRRRRRRRRRSTRATRSTRSRTSTTAGTATAGAGSRGRRARAGSRSTWPEPATIDRVVWGRDREGAYRDRLADRLLHRGRDRAGPAGGSSPRRPTAQPYRPPKPAEPQVRIAGEASRAAPRRQTDSASGSRRWARR